MLMQRGGRFHGRGGPLRKDFEMTDCAVEADCQVL